MARARRSDHSRTPERRGPLLPIAALAERHGGLTEDQAVVYAQCAAVCFSRHHTSPVDITLDSADFTTIREVAWLHPDPRTVRAYGNRDDATRDAAYGVCIAAVEMEMGLFAIGRAEVKTGADYYVSTEARQPDDSSYVYDLDGAYRLEVCGVNVGTLGYVKSRLQDKLRQLRKGESDLPGIAAVVGFQVGRVVIAAVDD